MNEVNEIKNQFTAFLDHDLVAAEFYRLPELVAEAWPPRSVGDAWSGQARWGTPDPKTWPWDVVEAAGCVPFEGPGQLRGMVGPRLLALAHPTSWSDFEGATPIRGKLRGACRALARAIGARRWVYVASSLDPFELLVRGRDFDALRVWLNERPILSIRLPYELVSA